MPPSRLELVLALTALTAGVIGQLLELAGLGLVALVVSALAIGMAAERLRRPRF